MAPSGRTLPAWLLAACVASGACARRPPPVAPTTSRDPPRLDAVVRVHGVGDCLGVRIAPGLALTAAHCVLGVRSREEIRVVAGLTPGGRTLPVTSCALHPALAPRFERCELGDRHAAERLDDVWNDLALLGLRDDPRDAPHIPLLPAAEAPQALQDADVWVVSNATPTWVDEPAPSLHWNKITRASESELRAEGADTSSISTRPGDSGGPLLVRRGGRWVVAGILAGGEGWFSTDSRFAPTSHTATAEWVARGGYVATVVASP